ncbi:flavin reductase family protein [Rhodoblastus acidophilus]|uniref:Flavin reductase family protein n=1 Tax=Candidatus Rhodoblastus alkanivorans TaxID=2954117 RepID=A0ABS9Z5Y2_9HYPH|nr:flavin reductase family protein [Candidatus Rhodoblastus alkanivorans]MCI4678675.1 flavin reductase family protein [Candidatus Rhodoblastus alkanivorans]MCI4683084.1 flavin reductase family protein [Candidatus Rhodoblastus alkanivorans]MDI4640395.1 flavin reductase family protein [Rhodoblastus acidophilus]
MLDPKAYRDAMSEIASPVHIIATDGPAGLAGMTVTALASVTDQPATLLVCVNRQSPSAPRFLKNKAFSVNSLGAADQKLADIFAGRTDEHFAEKFTHGLWRKGATGAPLLEGALANFDCRLIEAKDVGTHHILIGEVVAVARRDEGAGLLYHRRAYRRSDDEL